MDAPPPKMDEELSAATLTGTDRSGAESASEGSWCSDRIEKDEVARALGDASLTYASEQSATPRSIVETVLCSRPRTRGRCRTCARRAP
eukprot:TRINITY_DN18968_c0_g1_i1.p2 TRINITY_DN18968_c0_g1~~TRINITY_DN18968_c0_g1_i1.p2  ORF type:complete len:104 (-),score=8.35 TRINITY_DN18968_c0_g1_i1:886-1152(-)